MTRGFELRPVAECPESHNKKIAFEIWTRNRIYLLSNELVCLMVLDRETKVAHDGHEMLGWQVDDSVHRSKDGRLRPLPQPGDHAVFRKGAAIKRTSVTARVVIRVMKKSKRSDDVETTVRVRKR